MTIFKAIAHARELKQRAICNGFAVVDSFDANGMPILTLNGTCPLAVERVLIRIKVRPDEAQHVDGLGLPQRAYSPHMAEMIMGTIAIANGGVAWRLIAEAMAVKLGMRLDVYSSVNADDSHPIADDFSGLIGAATLIASIPADELNPILSSQ